MNSLLKEKNNIERENSEIINAEKEISLHNNINNNKANNIRLKTYKNYKINKNIFNNKINVGNKKIEDNKINKNEKKHKNLILLKYEDYKEKIKNISRSLNLTSRENKRNINLNNINNKGFKSKLNKEFISVEKMFKRYNTKEWDKIYTKRFKSYEENINKKREEKRKLKEKEKKQKEDEIINYSNKKRAKSSKKQLYNNINYRTLFIRNNCKSPNQEQKYKNTPKKMCIFHNNNNNIKEIKKNKRYMEEDFKNIINNNIIYFKGNIYDLEEERRNLILMSKRINISKSTDYNETNFLDKNNKYSLKYNKSNERDIISEADNLIFEFIIRHLE